MVHPIATANRYNEYGSARDDVTSAIEMKRSLTSFAFILLIGGCSEPATEQPPAAPAIQSSLETSQVEELRALADTVAPSENEVSPPPLAELPKAPADCRYRLGSGDPDALVLYHKGVIATVRFAGIEVPTAVRAEARSLIEELLTGAELSVEPEAAADAGFDPAVYLYRCSDGLLINSALVQRGLAVPLEGTSRYRDLFQREAIEALKEQRGVWKP